MKITELQVLEARLLLAKADREWYYTRSDYDFMSEVEDSDKSLLLAEKNLAEYLVAANKTDLDRLEERVAAASSNHEAASKAYQDAHDYYVEAHKFWTDLLQELECYKAEGGEV
jgi:hypothetical protein